MRAVLKFSVITPTKNNLNKLRRCIGSVRGQSGVEIEHFIQDACSTDGTTEWLSNQNDLSWASENDNGMYDAINRGWKRANGDILSWLNSDEQYLPGTLQKVSNFFQSHPDVDFIYGDTIVVDGNGSPIAARREIRLSIIYIANSFLNAFSCTTFFRRRLLDKGILRLDDRYKYAADMDLILRLLRLGKRFAKLTDYLSTFTVDGSNMSRHPEILEETTEIQRRYGGFKPLIMRRMIMMGRYIERLVSGSYRRMDVQYNFAMDEVPHYCNMRGHAVPGSFRIR